MSDANTLIVAGTQIEDAINNGMILLRISELDDLASVGLPTVVEGLQGGNAVKEETGDDRPNPLR